MSEEFDLSSKISSGMLHLVDHKRDVNDLDWIQVKDVKEFIRLLKEETGIIDCDDEAGRNALKIINKLAGEVLR